MLFLPLFASAAESGITDEGIAYIAAAVAVGLSTIAGGIAVGLVGAAAMGAVGEKPEISGKALIFLGLAEGIAIYGLIIAIMILGKVG
ncbi:ATP synthase subunit C [Sulfurovum riftiae]|uniref:ATP synthase subunit C n=1 Tax=Sulfurovum riftiae TaxID=1630136 RepID=A0A151CGK2_9BACT|nr:ATP synthase subunit C [Sulfurovum riftiae]